MSPISSLIAFLLLISVTFGLQSSSVVIINGNSTITSENKTFELGFFSTNDESKWYLGIWFASIPTPTYVWVANRETPARNPASASVEITADDGRMVINDAGEGYIWKTDNVDKAAQSKLLDDGNFVLLSDNGEVVWQSFDFPTDTWLPGMNLTRWKSLTCWRSSNDPSPGRYSLRLKPQEYGEIELVFGGNESYWSTGNWTGSSFTNVPEMTVKYIYRFHFTSPFTPTASFGYTETSLESGLAPPLTRFHVDFSGQVRQYTWSPQTENWNMFWSQPENLCIVYGLCGNLGLCTARMFNPCKCLAGFRPADSVSWDAGDFSGGCRRQSDDQCRTNDRFEEVGTVRFSGAITVSFTETPSMCETTCLNNCSCIGLFHNSRTNSCKNLYGSLLNLRNLTLDSTIDDKLYVRIQIEGTRIEKTTRKINIMVLIFSILGVISIFAMIVITLLSLRERRIKRRNEEEESVFPVTNLKVFSYKELHAATKGFSEKLGHGGFGAVFRGELSDSSPVAVKRLERPGGAEREFRAEVCTIGNIHHVNLVRLRGFCSQNSHRLLVYDYMPNGPLSAYLKRDGQILNWGARFRIAIETARGIAYLHEECRDCIIHCDIKPENILLDENFSAKVSDFGLAKLICRDLSRVLATMRGTWGYVAPEWISGVAITAKADVYSYGMTLLELIGGRRNVEGGPPSAAERASGNGENWYFPPWAAGKIIEGNMEAVLDERLGGNFNEKEAERMGLVAVWCIQDEEAMRPAMGMVVKMLEGVVEVTIPPPPKLLQALVSGETFHGVGGDSGNRESSGGCYDSNVRQQSMDSKESQLTL